MILETIAKLNIPDMCQGLLFLTEKTTLMLIQRKVRRAITYKEKERTVNYTQPAIKASTYFMSTTTHSLTHSLFLSISRTLVPSLTLSLSHIHIYIYTFCELLRSKDMHGKKTTFCPELFSLSLSPQAYYIY